MLSFIYIILRGASLLGHKPVIINTPDDILIMLLVNASDVFCWADQRGASRCPQFSSLIDALVYEMTDVLQAISPPIGDICAVLYPLQRN